MLCATYSHDDKPFYCFPKTFLFTEAVSLVEEFAWRQKAFM